MSRILTPEQIARRTERLAWQILESSPANARVWLAGVAGQGSLLAQRLYSILEELRPGKARLITLRVDKKAHTQPEVFLDGATEAELANSHLVLVDDVLNSGRTLSYCMARFLTIPLQRLEVAVLVERSHRAFPIRANFSGYQLSTTLEEHVDVVLEGQNSGVFIK